MSKIVYVELTDVEVEAALSALYAYRSETEHYLRSYTTPSAGHDECCETARVRAKMREEQQRDLTERQRRIDGAIQTLEDAQT